jgi:hypothetical protein
MTRENNIAQDEFDAYVAISHKTFRTNIKNIKNSSEVD